MERPAIIMFLISRGSYPIFAGAALGVLLFVYVFLFKAPEDFPVGKVVVIPEGLSLRQAAELLEKESVVASPMFFSALVSLVSRDKVIAGGYLFERRLSVFSVAFRTTTGDHRLGLQRLTFPEGTTVKEMSEDCARIIPGCKREEFMALSLSKEGYLFPDTYFFLPGAPASEVVRAMEQNFENKIKTLEAEIKKFGKPLREVVIMASLLEGEARRPEDQRMVAGILWSRLKIDMPLQVDAAFKYINGKTMFDLSSEDLGIDSPYNTYRYKGFPPTPISNPGLEAIEAAITPTRTPYLFYLTDKGGEFHYAKTHEEHVRNKERYLK